MGLFSCDRCHQIFSKKYNYEQHLKRKVICKIMPKPVGSSTQDTAYDSSNVSQSRDLYAIPPKRSVAIPLNNDNEESYSSGSIPDFDLGVESIYRPGRPRPKTAAALDLPKSTSKQNSDAPSDIVDWEHLSRAIRRQEEELEAMRIASTKVASADQFKHPIEEIQVTAVGEDDDFFEILIKEVGDEEKLLRFIMSCAQDGLAGDWRLLNRVYFDKKKTKIGFPITCINSDRNRGKYEFIDENGTRIFDKNGVLLSKRLARSLQNTYLKISNRLIKISIAKYADPMNFLAENDLQAVNSHVEQLSTEHYQKKLLGTLKYPTED